MTLRSLATCLTAPLILVACGSGSGSDPGPAPPPAPAPTPAPPTAGLTPGISVLAGAAGGEGDADGPVGRLQAPGALAIDRAGDIYVANFGATVRRLAAGADGATAVTTRWRGAQAPAALAADAAGNLIGILDHRIVRIGPDGALATLAGGSEAGMADGIGAAARFSSPQALAIDAAGLVHVADGTSIRTVDANGEVRTHRAATAALSDVVGELNGQPMYVAHSPTGLAFDQAGNLAIAVAGAPVRKVTPTGARQDTRLDAMVIAADRNGQLFGFANCALYRADAAGEVALLAGAPTRRGATDGRGADAAFGSEQYCDARIAADGAGHVYVADSANDTLRKVAPDGTVATVAGQAAQRGMADGAGAAARFSDDAVGLAFDGRDALYTVQDGKVRKITRAGVVTTLSLPAKDANGQPVTYFPGSAAHGGSLLGVANRVLYLVGDGALRPLAGSPTTPRWTDGSGDRAGFGDICDATRDGAGNLYLLDCHAQRATPDAIPDALENRIRKVTPLGIVTTVYATARDDGTRQPWHIVADRQGAVFASNNNGEVLRIAADGAVSSIRVDARHAGRLTVDASGRLYLASDHLLPAIVQQIGADGQAQLIAGRTGQRGLVTGPLPGSLNLLGGLTVDDQGVLYVLTENAVVRIVR